MSRWKPQEITKQEYLDITKALKEKAFELASEAGESSCQFFSGSLTPCHYEEDNTIPKSFNCIEPSHFSTDHFLPFPCSCKKQAIMANKEEVICLCKDYSGDDYRYYITTHRIGRCPWKRKTK